MVSRSNVARILGLPDEISPLIEFFLSTDEIKAILSLSDQLLIDKDDKAPEVPSLVESTTIQDRLSRKGLIHKANGVIKIKTGIDCLWALLLNAVEDDTYIPSNELNLANGFLRSYYSNAVKEHLDQYRIFPLLEAFLPRYQSAENQDNVLAILENAKTIVQRPCRCREILQNCLRPTDTCLVLNDPMAYDIARGQAKLIDLERAEAILHGSFRNGNVLILHQEDPEDHHARMELHSCCSCCSVLLGAIKDLTTSETIHMPKLVAEVDPSKCNGCATCKEVCMFGARRLVGGVCHVDLSHCVGCGLCIPWCTERAVRMARKEII
ncbi:MAG: hypothetical protein ACE5OZ_10740 [Candidatus Heimdallarchaeota archaeon]